MYLRKRLRKFKYLIILFAIFIVLVVLIISEIKADSQTSKNVHQDLLSSLQQSHISLDKVFGKVSSPVKVGSFGNYAYYPALFSESKLQNADSNKNSSICLATHTTVQNLFWLAYQNSNWDGFLSVSVYVPGNDISIAYTMVSYLYSCFHSFWKVASFHFVFPLSNIAILRRDLLVLPVTPSCSKYEAEKLNKYFFDFMDSKDEPDRILYPQNLMRNIARSHCPTSHAVVVDIDMIASKSLANHLDKFLSTNGNCLACAFILPIYEISTDVHFPPDNKNLLIELINDKFARPYHESVFVKNQRNSHLEKWESSTSTSTNEIYILYDVKDYEEGWEPVIILHWTAPNFDDRFVGYGKTRSSHVFLLHHLNYSFHVLENGFFAHRGFQTKENYPNYRIQQIQENENIYRSFKRELYFKAGWRKYLQYLLTSLFG